MSNTLRQIERIDAQLVVIDKLLKEKGFMGCGITVDFCLGPRTDETRIAVDNIHLGITGLPEALLQTLQQSLRQTREYWLSCARKEAEVLSDFLKDET